MKRVLLTVHKFFPEHRAGTEVLTLKVAQELQRRGTEVLVCTADPPDLDARHALGSDTENYVYEGVPVKVFREPLRLRGYTFDHEYAHPLMAAEFTRTLNEFAPDIVHTFHAQNFSGSIIHTAADRGLPVVSSATDFWFVCPIVQLTLPDGSPCRGPSPGAANCLSCYTPKLLPPEQQFTEALKHKYSLVFQALDRLPRALRKQALASLFQLYCRGKLPAARAATINRVGALREAANRTSAIMVPTRLMRDIFVENGISESLLHIVPFGIDTAPLLPFLEKTPSDRLRIGFVGAVSYHKGVDLLIEAFQLLPEGAQAQLKIYGNLEQFPEYGQKLQAQAAAVAHAAPFIEFCGTFPNSEFGRVLQNLDLLVVPSRWYENTPLVMQSALATRTPLVVTNLGGMSELVKDGENGLLFDLNDAKSLSAKLAMLINDRQIVEAMRRRIKPERTIADMADDIQSIYATAAASAERGRIASLAGI